MRNSRRHLMLGSAAVVGSIALGSCGSPGDSPPEGQIAGADRPAFESVEEVVDRSFFALIGVVGEGVETTLAPRGESEEDSVRVVEYSVSVVDPLSSPLEQDAETAVVVAGGEGFESDIVSLEPGQEYLFFVTSETQDASYSLVGIDVGAFQAQSDGSYVNPVGMVVEADEVESYAQRAAEIEG